MPLEIGTLLNGRYRIERVLGHGGFGAVYLAHDDDLGIACAVKENLSVSPQAERQFRREATLLAALRHPHLPRVTDHFVLGGQQYLVMDFVAGDDLKQRLDQTGPLAEADVLRWGLQLAEALEYLHGRTPPVIHRDIKPANIKVTPEGAAVLVDFGIAKVAEAGQKTTTGAAALTSGYAPPEQYQLGATDGRTDEYALAATLYHLLTGRLPPDSVERLIGQARLVPPNELRPDLPPHIAAALNKALSLNPARRFPEVAAFARALRGEGGPVDDTEPALAATTQPAPTAPTTPARPARRWSLALWLGGGLALLLGALWLNPLGAVFQRAAPATATLLESPPPTPAPATQPREAQDTTRPPTQAPATASPTLTASLTPAPTATPTQPVIVPENAARLERIGAWGPGRLNAVVWSPDEQWLAALTSRGTVIFEAAALQEAGRYPGEQVLAFGPEDLAILSSPDGAARLVHWQTGATVRDLSEYEMARAAFSPDGGQLAFRGRVTPTSQRDGLGILDLATGALRVIAPGNLADQSAYALATLGGLAFLPGGRLLQSGNLGLWDLEQASLVRQLPPQVYLFGGEISPDGRWLAYLERGFPARLTLEGLENSSRVRQINLDGTPYLTAGENHQTTYASVGTGFSADSEFILVAYERRPYLAATRAHGREYWIVRYPVRGGPPEIAPGRLTFPRDPPADDRYYYYRQPAFVLGPAGTRGASLTVDNVLRVWDLTNGQLQAETEPFYLGGQMGLSPDGETIASLHALGVDIFQRDTGVRVQTLRNFRDPFKNLAVMLLPDRVLLVERPDSVEFWDLQRGTLSRRVMLADPQAFIEDERPGRVVVSPDGRWMAHRSKYITVYDLAAGQPRHTFGSANTPHYYTFTPDGQYLAVTSGQAVGLWNTETGQRDRNLAGHGVPTGALAFSPDGARLISASGDLWEVATGKLLAGFEWGTEALAVSPDGRLVIGSDGRLVAMQTGETVGRLNLLRGRVLALAFTPDGRRLVAQYDDGVIDILAVK